MRPGLLSTLGVAIIISTITNAATIPEIPVSSRSQRDVPSLPELDLEEKPASWSSRLRTGFIERFFGRRHGQPEHEKQKHLGLGSSLLSRYAGDVVLRFNISTPEEGKAMVEATQILFLDVWSATKDHVDIRLSEDVVPSLLGLLPDSLQHAHTRLMPDLGRVAQDTFPGAQKSFSDDLREEKDRSCTNNLFFQDYQPLSVIERWMKLLESLFPTFVQVVSLGQSYEGREILGFRVGVRPKDGERKKAIVVNGAAHAREWISVSTVSFLAYSFITNHQKKEKSANDLVEAFDWFFIPTLNVDGYAYTWEHDRLWRKNRQPTSLSFCKGIDLDRAYNAHWESVQLQSNPCSDNYPGEEPFEAVESRRFADFIDKMHAEENIDFVGYLDFHSYSQQILYPFSYTCDLAPPDLENLEELGMGLAKAIRIRSGEHYEVTSACDGSGYFTQVETAGGGSALDYFYSRHIPYAYQIKLRDTGSYGFLLPRENIVPTGEESLAVLKYFGDFLREGMIRDNKEAVTVVAAQEDNDEVFETELKK